MKTIEETIERLKALTKTYETLINRSVHPVVKAAYQERVFMLNEFLEWIQLGEKTT